MKKKSNFSLSNTNLSWKNLYDNFQGKLTQNIQKLKAILKRWSALKKIQIQIPNSEERLLQKFLKIKNTFNNRTRLKEFYNKFQLHYQNIDRPNTEQDVYLNFPLLGTEKWNLIISDKFKPQSYKSLKQIFTKIFIYTQGYIPVCQKCEGNFLKEIKKSKLNKSTYYEEKTNKNPLIFNIGIQKLPLFQLNSEKILQFQYVPYICLIGKSQNYEQNVNLIKQIEKQWKKDPRKNFQNQFPLEDKQKINQKNFYFQYQNKDNKQVSNRISEKFPMIFKSQKINREKGEDYMFKLKEFFVEYEQDFQNIDQRAKYRQNIQNQIENQEQQFVQNKVVNSKEKAISFKNAKDLINLIEKIPNFKFNLTEQQKNVIGNDGNVIVIGRSGTGKTTCALVRLFAIEILYKQNLLKDKIKNKQIQKKNFQAADIQRFYGLNNVFLTASSTLIIQIKKQYQDMIDNLKQQLKLHKKKKSESQDFIQQIQFVSKQIQSMNESKKDIQTMKNNQKQQQKKIVSLKYLKSQDFPAFYTIKNFVIMIDGVLQRPYFTRFQQQNIKEEDEQQNLRWNQQKQQSSKIKIEVRKTVNNSSKQFKKLKEITYDSFIQEFWNCLPKVFLSEVNLSPPIVWSQIYSIIKGSVKSHSYECKYLSQSQYLKHSTNKFYADQDKKSIYKIFKYYEEWKNNTYHYDFMDVVNNCLFQIKFKNYKGPKINYLFIDQVQDLTSSTIYLLSKIVQNGVFYSGDTAQAIVKGVSFRFSDIKTMYHQKFQLQQLPNGRPFETQLTQNFRSHNSILQLANNVVSAIQILFPKTIDSLKKQTSSLPGPKPFIMNSKNQMDIFKLLCDSQIVEEFQDKQSYLSQKMINKQIFNIKTIFSSQQIIIVRNIQEKQILPKILKLGIVLTIQEAKGLQFQDVILYKFFQSCKCIDKWKLIQYLIIEEDQIQKNQYQNSIKKVQTVLNLPVQQLKIELEQCTINDKTFYKVKRLKLDPKILGINKNKYIQLLTQLKILYTIITRAKNCLVICDSKIPQSLIKLWKQVNVINFITAIQDLEKQNKKLFAYKQKYKSKRYVNEQQQWRNQGYKLYNRKNYDQAIKCFQMINDYQTATIIKAQKIANLAFIEQKRYNNQLQNPRKLNEDEFAVLRNNLQEQKKPFILENFQEAGKLFHQVKRYKQAGQCFISAQKYKLAYHSFQLCQHKQGLALCCLKIEKYKQAALFYQQLNNIQKMLQSYSEGKLWSEGLNKFFQYQGFIQNPEIKCRMFTKNTLKDYLKTNKKHKKINVKPQQIKDLYQNKDFLEKVSNFLNEFYQSRYTVKIQQIINQMEDIEKKISLQKRISLLLQEKSQQMITMQEFYSQKNPQSYNQLKQDCQKFRKMQQTLRFNIQKFNLKHGSLNICKNKVNNLIQYLNHFMKQTNIKNFSNQSFFQTFKKKSNRDQNTDLYQKQYSELMMQDVNSRYQEFQFEESDYLQHQNYQNNSDQQVVLQDDDDDNFSIYSFCDTQIQQDNPFFQLIFRQNVMQNNNKKQLISFCQKIVEKTFKYTTNPNKLPMNSQNPLYLIRKIQSQYIKKQKISKKQFEMIQKIQNMEQYQICLFLSQFYQINENAWRFILSYCLQHSSHYQKGSKIFSSKSNVNFHKSSSTSNIIQQFLKYINSECLKIEIQSTFLFKERQINLICQGLILQGSYKSTLKYLSDEQYCDLTYRFSNYQKFMQKIKTIQPYKSMAYEYIIVQQTNRKDLLARLINVVSLQQIFWIYDSLQKKSFLSKTNWKIQVRLQEKDLKQIAKKLKQYSKRLHQEINQIKKKLSSLNQLSRSFPEKHLRQLKQKQKKEKEIKMQTLLIDEQISKKTKQIQLTSKQGKQYFALKNKIYQQISILDKKRMILVENQQFNQKQFNVLEIKKQQYVKQLNIADKKLVNSDNLLDKLNQQRHKLRDKKWKFADILQDLKKIQQKQQKQIKDCLIQIQQFQKLLRKNQALVQIKKEQFRKNIIQKRKQQLISIKKKQFQNSAMLKIKQKTYIPTQNDKFIFVNQFFAGFQNKILGATSNHYLHMIQRIIQNIFRPIDKMEDFMICELIIFYLSMINYQSYSQNVISYVERMDYYRQKGKQSQIYKQRQVKHYSKQINELKEIKKSRNLSALQLKNLNQLQIKLIHAKQEHKKFSQNNLIKSFFSALQKIKNIIQIIDNKHNFHFIEILLGFFQCRIVKNCKILWMVQNQYVIVKSSSILVSQSLKRKNTFCYYFDNQQETVLMKFPDVYSLLNNFINEGHERLIKKYIYLNYKFNDNKETKCFDSHEGMGLTNKNKQINENFYELSELQDKAEENFKIFIENEIPKELISYKEELLKFYFENGHKNHQSFHLVFRQLKQIQQTKKVFQKMDYFNNQLMIQMRKRVDNLKEHLKRWKIIAKQKNILIQC